MMRSYVPINKDLIPYSFEIELGGEVFEIGVRYNSHADLYTLSLSKDGEEVCAGEPLIYGVPLWGDVYSAGKFPAVTIVPFSESGDEIEVSSINLGETVFLLIDDEEESILGG